MYRLWFYNSVAYKANCVRAQGDVLFKKSATKKKKKKKKKR